MLSARDAADAFARCNVPVPYGSSAASKPGLGVVAGEKRRRAQFQLLQRVTINYLPQSGFMTVIAYFYCRRPPAVTIITKSGCNKKASPPQQNKTVTKACVPSHAQHFGESQRAHAAAAAAAHQKRPAATGTSLVLLANINESECGHQATAQKSSTHLHRRLGSAPRVLARVSIRREAAAGGFPESLQALLCSQSIGRDAKMRLLSGQAVVGYRRAIVRDACSTAALLQRRMRG
jgi:hypothetical protein